jgi:hypothetical protein
VFAFVGPAGSLLRQLVEVLFDIGECGLARELVQDLLVSRQRFFGSGLKFLQRADQPVEDGDAAGGADAFVKRTH